VGVIVCWQEGRLPLNQIRIASAGKGAVYTGFQYRER
jgi:hypothetical protein